MQDNSVHTSEAVTDGIRVVVTSQFTHADPQQQRWLFSYTVRISNESPDTVQLVSRHWIITNGSNDVEEVKGPGVVGHKPTLAPGQSFEYSSGCPLTTPSGIMVGTYEMADSGGTHFDVEIPAFSLDSPYQLRLVN